MRDKEGRDSTRRHEIESVDTDCIDTAAYTDILWLVTLWTFIKLTDVLQED